MGVAKTCISEIFVKEHELKAFGILNGMWGLGTYFHLNRNHCQQKMNECFYSDCLLIL